MIPTQLFPLIQSLNFQGHLDQRGGWQHTHVLSLAP